MINDYHTAEDLDRLNRIHEARTTDPAVLASIVHQAVDDTLVSQERIISGEVNEVYTVDLRNTGQAVLRISRHQESNFPYEAWATEQARKVGVPVPKVINFGTFQTDIRPLHYSIQERLKGKTFDNLLWSEQIPAERARLITNEAGELLARLHSINTSGYGRINELGKGQFRSVSEMMVGERIKHGELYTKLLTEQGLSMSEIDVVFVEFQSAENYLTQPHLIHRDYAPKHMFIDDNDRIVGIIDWEDAKSGDATFDFSTWQFWFSDSGAPIKWLIEGYKRQSSLGDNFEQRFKIAQLYLLTGLVNYYVNEAPFPKWAEAGTQAIRKLVSPELHKVGER